MTVATFENPNYTTMLAATYKARIDGDFAAHHRLAGAWAPHEQDASSPQPDLSVRIDAGYTWDGSTLTEIAAQTVSGFTVPSAGQHRIDRVVYDPRTGVAERVAGTPVTGSPSATPPALPHARLPVCRVLITSSDAAITNSMITDERTPLFPVSSLIILTSGGNSDDRARLQTFTAGGGIAFTSLNTNATDYEPITLQGEYIAGQYRTGVATLAEGFRLDSTHFDLPIGRIRFPATQNASSDANTLDDYEEGTWTPSVGGTATYITQIGRYTKIGRMVYLHGNLQIEVLGTGSTSTISGVPFTSATDGTKAFAVVSTFALATSVVSIAGRIQNGGSGFDFLSRTAAATEDNLNAVFQNSATVCFDGCYNV